MDCSTNFLTLKQHLEAMLRVSGPLAGLPIVAVSGHEESALNCNNQEATFESLLKDSIGVDSCGKPAIRVKFIDSCDLKISCSNHDETNPLRDMFAYDATLKTVALVINQSS